jgi:hypothetical protein
MGRVFCIACGTENPADAEYCFSCGKRLVRAPTPAIASVSNPSSPRTTPPQSTSSTAQPLRAESAGAHLPRIEIKPKPIRNGILAILGCSIFTIGGAFMLASGEKANMYVGALSIVFFGGGGLYSIPKIMRRKLSFVLTSDSLQQVAPVGTAQIAWSDIEKIGTVSLFGTHLAGVRLKTYDRYIASMSSDMADTFHKTLPALKAISRAVSLADMPYAVAIQIWSAFKGKDEPADVLKSFGKVGTYVEALLWNREHFGYDLVWGWSDRDRSAPEFAKLLEQYRAAESG